MAHRSSNSFHETSKLSQIFLGVRRHQRDVSHRQSLAWFSTASENFQIYLDVEDGVATCSTYYNDDSVTAEETVKCGDRASRVEAQLEGGVVKSHLLKRDRSPSSEYLSNQHQPAFHLNVHNHLNDGSNFSSNINNNNNNMHMTDDDDDERNRLLHYAKMDFARSSSDASSDQEQTSSV